MKVLLYASLLRITNTNIRSSPRNKYISWRFAGLV